MIVNSSLPAAVTPEEAAEVRVFYRGSTNGGIFTLLTASAHSAAVHLAAIKRGERTATDRDVELLKAEQAYGTYAFASTRLFDDPRVRADVCGSVDHMDEWTRGHIVRPGFVQNHVPFSSGPQEGHPAWIYRRSAADVITTFGMVRPTN